ncbi:MAG: hypothetical protein Fur006_40870 [Coleofasciculaceae cyanobacterium]
MEAQPREIEYYRQMEEFLSLSGLILSEIGEPELEFNSDLEESVPAIWEIIGQLEKESMNLE